MACRYLFINSMSDCEEGRVMNESPLITYRDEEVLKKFKISKSQVASICHIVKDDLFRKGC